MAQLTIYKPDNSIADVLIISDSLYKELSRVARLFELEYLNLAFIREIKRRVLVTVTTVESLDKNTLNWVIDRELKESLLKRIASKSFNWFDELLDVISCIERLSNPHSLRICLTK